MNTVLLFLGLLLGALVMAKLLSIGLFRITKRDRLTGHDWKVSAEREQRLRDAAMWKGYRRE